MLPRCGWPKPIRSRVTISLSPGPGGAPSPCTLAEGVCVDPCRLAPFPVFFEPNFRFMLDFLRRFRWDVYAPRFNWFYNPITTPGESPCTQFKILNNGIDVTVFAPDSAVPICTTSRFIDDLSGFQIMNAANCTSIQPENYMITTRRVAYGLNLISACGQLRTVVLREEEMQI